VIVVLCSWSGRPALLRTQHDYHHDKKVKPEATTAVTELLMMGGKTPETCWAVNKRQDNKLKNCCVMLVIYLNCTMMHGFTYLKLILSIHPSIYLFFRLSLLSDICDNLIFVLLNWWIPLVLSTMTLSLTDSYDWYVSIWSVDSNELCEIWGDDTTA
jgi:hypothetical protein